MDTRKVETDALSDDQLAVVSGGTPANQFAQRQADRDAENKEVAAATATFQQLMAQ
jgi:hypothetical protein